MKGFRRAAAAAQPDARSASRLPKTTHERRIAGDALPDVDDNTAHARSAGRRRLGPDTLFADFDEASAATDHAYSGSNQLVC